MGVLVARTVQVLYLLVIPDTVTVEIMQGEEGRLQAPGTACVEASSEGRPCTCKAVMPRALAPIRTCRNGQDHGGQNKNSQRPYSYARTDSMHPQNTVCC